MQCRFLSAVLFFCATASAQSLLADSQSSPFSGSWILVERFTDDTRSYRLSLEVHGNQIKGEMNGAKLEGTVEDLTLKMHTLAQEIENKRSYVGQLKGKVLVGEGMAEDRPMQWTAYRPVERPSGGPSTHTFEPKEFHRFFASTIPPVLRIFPGDTVKTTSVDAGGYDKHGARRSLGGNPLTGPFYIEGALPGDTLVVRLKRVQVNRETAQSGQIIVYNALTPGYLSRDLKPAEDFDSTWKFDFDKGIATLIRPSEALTSLAVPLRPMVGCIGVAPTGNQAIPTSDSGLFGGNMDYNELREGTTVYLPIFHEGALLFIGDGHAAQGDGELTGDAIEAPLDIEFSVDVIPTKRIGIPRAENEEYLMVIGIGTTLDQALQRATAEMARWMQAELMLNTTEVSLLLGFAIEYDVADVVGNQVSIVSKVPKSIISKLKRTQD